MAKVQRVGSDLAAVPEEPSPETIIRHVELRFRPTDRILFKAGDQVEAGQVIGQRDISLQRKKLEGDHRRERERLQEQLDEIASQLENAREEVVRTRQERAVLETERVRLENQPLFAREYLKLLDTLASAADRIERGTQRISTLEQRQKEVRRQIEVQAERLAESLALLERQAQIFAGFTGEVVRIDTKPGNEAMVYSVLYRGELGPDWDDTGGGTGLEFSLLDEHEEETDSEDSGD